MANPSTLTLWQKILADPASVVSLGALIINILITVFNYFWLKNDRKGNRKYEMDTKFYQFLVLDVAKGLIDFSSKSKKELHSLKVQVGHGGANPKAFVEAHIENLDGHYEEVAFNVVPFIKGYSFGLGEGLEKIVENYYDQVTEIFSQFNRVGITSDFEYRVFTRFSQLTAQYIKDIINEIKKECPL